MTRATRTAARARSDRRREMKAARRAVKRDAREQLRREQFGTDRLV